MWWPPWIIDQTDQTRHKEDRLQCDVYQLQRKITENLLTISLR